MPKYAVKNKNVEQFQKKLGKTEFDNRNSNMFNVEYLGGKQEADALISRYSKQTKLTNTSMKEKRPFLRIQNRQRSGTSATSLKR